MSLRAVLIAAAIVGLPGLVLVFGKLRIVAVTQPPVLDCGGLEAAVCEEAALETVDGFMRTEVGVAGQLIYFKLEPASPGRACGDYHFELLTSTFGPFGWVEGYGGEPLC